MKYSIKQSSAFNLPLKMFLASDHVTAATGKTLTVTLSKNGGSFAAAGATVSELTNGWYNVALTTTDTNTLGALVIRATATACDDAEVVAQVVAFDPSTTWFGGVRKNTALAAFSFLMFDSSDHVSGKTGLTVTAQRSIDGGSFASCANSAAEVANGVYKIDLAAADLNGDVVTFRFTATGADPCVLTIKTQP